MSTPVFSNARPRRLALSLALVALLFGAWIQVGELAHQHSADETRAHCLLCKADSGACPVAAISPAPERVLRVKQPRVRQCRAIAETRLLPPTRAPPTHS